MKTVYALILIISSLTSFAQIGIGTTAPNAALDITSASNGILIPRVALTSKIVSAPVVNPNGGGAPEPGTMVFNTATSNIGNANDVVPGFYYWSVPPQNQWIYIGNDPKGSLGPWNTRGNQFTQDQSDFVGTIDNVGLAFRTNNLRTGYISNNGKSVFFGLNAGGSNASLLNNIFIGESAGFNATNMSHSIFMGNNSGLNAINSLNSNFFGNNAGNAANGANNSNFLGSGAGQSAGSASHSNFMGNESGKDATSANFSNFLGNYSGISATGANHSNFFGQYAGNTASAANNSNFFGQQTGNLATNANRSNFFGFQAGAAATNANNSNFIGSNAGQNANNANNSTFIGTNAGAANFSFGSSSDNAVFIGTNAGFNADKAQGSVFIGNGAGDKAYNSSNSIYIGKNAGLLDNVDYRTVAGTSILIGDDSKTAGFKNSIAIGKSATNTRENQFLIGDSYINMRLRGVEYVLPSAQGGAGTVLANNGSGTLSWTTPSAPNAWSLLGNAGTDPTTNFIGTTGPEDLVFRTNNLQTGRINKDGQSVALGISAGSGASIQNTAYIGNSAGVNATGADFSYFMGSLAGRFATSASNSNFIGREAGSSATNASFSNFIGRAAGKDASDANNSSFIGSFAGASANNAVNANFFGNNAGVNATFASNANFIGTNAGNGATNANNSIFIGASAGLSDTVANFVAGNTSILIGDNTSTGGFTRSIAMGKAAANTKSDQFALAPTYINLRLRGVDYVLPSVQGASNTLLSNNGAGVLNWTAAAAPAWNLTGNLGTTPGTNFIGTTDNQDLVFKTNNVQTARIDKSGASFSVGANAGVGGSINNTNFIGQFAGNSAPNANFSNFLGSTAGNQATNASNSNFFGSGAGSQATNAYNSNFIGEIAGFIALNAYNSNFIGSSAGVAANTANNSNFFGSLTGYQATNASNSNFFGQLAGRDATSASYSNFSGFEAGLGAVTAASSNFFGPSAGSGAANASDSNFLGAQAGMTATNANNSNFLGQSAGYQATHANSSNFIGTSAGGLATTAYNSNFIGTSAGFSAATASNSNFIGAVAGSQATNAYISNFIGSSAGQEATNAYNSNFIGDSAGGFATNANTSNFIGRGAGFGAVNANNSIFIGDRAGQNDTVNNTTPGLSSILIGDDTKTGGFSNSIAIGKSAINTIANQFLIGSSYFNFSFRGVNYQFPSAQGASGQVLTNNGSGGLTWSSTSTTAWGLTGNGGTTPASNFIGTTNAVDFVVRTNNTEKMRVLSGGNVGIATAVPSQILSLGGNAARTINMERHTTLNTAGNNLTLLAGGATSGATDRIGGNLVLSSGTATGTGSSDINFQTVTAGTTGTADRTPTTKMTVLGNGNVGINATAPSERLEIGGNLRVSGAIMPNNLAGTSGQVLTSAGAGIAPTWTTSATVTNVTGTAPINVATGSTTPVISLNDGGVTAIKLANDAVTTAKILDANVTTAKIANDAVTTAKILDSNVTTAKILDANVTTTKIANDAVITVKILDANVTTTKIANDAVTTAKILDANVTTAKILDGTVANADLDTSVGGIYKGSGTTPASAVVVSLPTSGTLAFTPSGTQVANQFAVDGTTFSVDALNNRVGIGTATPSESLQIEGNVRVSGAIMPNNFSGLAGQILTSAGANVAPTWNALPSLSVQPYETLNTGGTYNVPLTSYTVRVFNGANTITLPTPVGNTGKIFIIIGGVGIATKTFNSAAGIIYDDSAGANVTVINAGQRYMVQSDDTNWIVIGR